MNIQSNLGKILAIAVAVVATLTVVISLWLNPPSEYRAITLDNMRVQRLGFMESTINGYYKDHVLLPDKLETLFSTITNAYAYENMDDPETHQPFAYEKLGEKSYRICINFARSSDEEKANKSYLRSHHAGLNCFEHDLNAEKK